MTTITLTDFQIQKVLDEHCNLVEPPIEPQPPIEPPEPPVVLPPVPTELYAVNFATIFGTALTPNRVSYPFQHVQIPDIDGMSVRIIIPQLTKLYDFRMMEVENNTASGATVRYGVLSARRNFVKPFIAEKVWGAGHGLQMILGPQDSGRVIYFNYKIMLDEEQFSPWIGTVSALLKAII